MNELEPHVEMTELYLHTTFIRRRSAYFWNKQRANNWNVLKQPVPAALQSKLPALPVSANKYKLCPEKS